MSLSKSYTGVLLFGAVALGSAPGANADPSVSLSTLIETVLPVACSTPYTDVQRLRPALPDTRILNHDVRGAPRTAAQTSSSFLSPNGATTHVTLTFPGGQLRRIVIERFDPEPRWSIRVDGNCNVVEVREIKYANGVADRISVLSPDLSTETLSITLNPAVPESATTTTSDRVRVGLIDSGVNYTLPSILDHLEFDSTGALLGRDLWDGDDRPFDVDTGRSPFAPFHHGSSVMSVLVREASNVGVLPVRYPRPDMSKMAEAIDWLADQGGIIVNVAMGSNDIDDWSAFSKSVEQNPNMLFIVSAGNDGRDIDREPVYPAALGHENILVVTSSELDGRLARGSNWGVENVDIMVPAERIDVVDHRGAPGKASGSSFAVPRVSALAARLSAANPSWRASELKKAILDRARRTRGRPLVRYGWIPDPSDGP